MLILKLGVIFLLPLLMQMLLLSPCSWAYLGASRLQTLSSMSAVFSENCDTTRQFRSFVPSSVCP
ncbi:MAG: hypothetical protein KHW62_04745 [Clostridiales bacterium]|nr:hypothetical protein [Clostridiales bacterium]